MARGSANDNNDPDFTLRSLMADIETKIGRTLQTPSDFNYLVQQIKLKCDEKISPHTLMRVWGYLSSNTNPSVTTLSILSRFLGYMDYRNYTLDLNFRINEGSGFIESDTITAEMLEPGDELIVEWEPARKLTLSYSGNFVFKVIANENSKLSEGVEFRCVSFSKGLPFLAYILNASNDQLNYVGGKKTGISSLLLNKIKQRNTIK